MYLVLDKSGSMKGAKMGALKKAVKSMENQFEALDPKHQFVRVGAVAYNGKTIKPSAISWGAKNANKYVKKLKAKGGTNSAPAVALARSKLMHAYENWAHKKTTGQIPSKIMVFMTDGENSKYASDWYTKNTCKNAKDKDGIEIYAVAFRAPARGQNLLKSCASSKGHYFNASNSQELIKAFKKIGAATASKLTLTR